MTPNQPKPATEFRGSPEQFHGDTYDPRKPKPATGEWTADGCNVWLPERNAFECVNEKYAQFAADAHNAAIAAERSKLAASQVGNKAAKAFMDYLRANTGDSDEWPIELKVADDSIEPINTLLNQFEKAIYATDTEALDAYVAQQLAAEREEHAKALLAKQTRIEIFQAQLAAERSKVKELRRLLDAAGCTIIDEI